MAKQEEKVESQEGFDWEMATDDVKFFEDEPSKEEEEDSEEEEKTPSGTSKKEDSEEDSEEEEEEITFFTEEEEEEKEGEGEEEEEGKTQKPKGNIKSVDFVENLKAAGLLDFELEEGTELTEDLAKEILEDDIEDRATQMAEELIKDLPADVKALNKFILGGGTLEEYLSEKSKVGLPDLKIGMDLTEENNQVNVIQQRLKKEGRDSEYIEAQIEFLKDKGLLEKTAKADYKEWEKAVEEANTKLVEEKRKAKEKAKETARAHKASVIDFVSKNKEVFDLPLSKKDKTEMGSYMADKSVVADNGVEMTPFHRDLYAAISTPEKAIALAKILRDDFNFKSLKESVATKKVGEIKKNVRRTSSSTSSRTSQTRSQKLSLADLLTD